MLNAMGGVVRGIAHFRSRGPERDATAPAHPATARHVHRRAVVLARICADSLTATPRARERAVEMARSRHANLRLPTLPAARRRQYRRRAALRFTADRAVPLAIALIVVLAAGVSLAPGAASTSAAQAGGGLDEAHYPAVRLAIGGAAGPVEFDGPITVDDPAAAGVPVEDGTIFKPVAVDTSVKSSAEMLQYHTVADGDTLSAIASRYGVSMMTVWWANKLTSKDALKAGRQLVIPPVNGLVVTVQPGDTLDSLAADNKIEAADILAVNELDDPNLIVGQVIVLPGAKGAPIPTPIPRPTQKPQVAGGGGDGGTVVYSGGRWAWPVAGGGNYISQYFRYGHLGVDIAAPYGTAIVAPLAGRVVFGGWKSNGGGYQVWISHGNGLYTAQNHMASVSVAAGQSVSRGQRVGRVGMSGWASGSHDHFEVWVGVPWESGSYRVNPLRYY